MSHTMFFDNSNILLIGADIDNKSIYPLRVIEKIELWLNLGRNALEENNVFFHVRVSAQYPPMQIRFDLKFCENVVIRLTIFYAEKQPEETIIKLHDEFEMFQRDCSVSTSNPE